MQPDIIEWDRHLVWSPMNKTMSFSCKSTSSSSIERYHLRIMFIFDENIRKVFKSRKVDSLLSSFALGIVITLPPSLQNSSSYRYQNYPLRILNSIVGQNLCNNVTFTLILLEGSTTVELKYRSSTVWLSVYILINCARRLVILLLEYCSGTRSRRYDRATAPREDIKGASSDFRFHIWIKYKSRYKKPHANLQLLMIHRYL